MKLVITTENKSAALTKEVWSILASHEADLIKLDVESAQIFIHTEELNKSTQGTIASQLMKLSGIKWVNQVDVLPEVETQNMLASLMKVMPDPIIGVNSKGQVAYANRSAGNLFKPHSENHKIPKQMKHIFVAEGWQQKVNAAAKSSSPTSIETIAGAVLLEVQGIKNKAGQMDGALLLFRNYDKIRASNYVIQGEEIAGLKRLIYQSEAFEAIVQKAKKFATVEAPLNIVGEVGTGKKLLAHACHSLSQRSNELFTLIDCHDLKSDELETLLFGINQRPGVLELNQSGTLYFSHIEYMAPQMQHKLFKHFSQTKDSKSVRIMVSSALKLDQYQHNEKLIPELIAMFDVLRLNVSPLRDRPEDIEPLMQHFLHQFNQQLGKNAQFSSDATTKMQRYYWPGNAAQLRHAIYLAMMNAQEGTIQANDLDLQGAMSLEADLEGLTLNEAVNEFERHFLQHWYQKYPSTRKLARQLGVSHTTIAQKINKYDLKQDQD